MRTVLAAWGLVFLPLLASAQSSDPLAQDGYILPPAPIKDAVLAPWWKNVSPGNFSPDGKHFVVLERDGLPTLASLGKAHINLAGLDIDTLARRSRGLTTRNGDGFLVIETGTGKVVRVTSPGLRAVNPVWSPDGTRIAFLSVSNATTEAWVYRLGDPAPLMVFTRRLLATAVDDLKWIGNDRLVSVIDPEAEMPPTPAIAGSPKVAVSDPKKIQLRTFASLLNSPFEADLLQFYTTGQICVIDINRHTAERVGKPAMITNVDPSPDGRYFRVTLMERPFSYLYPYQSFPEREVIWNEKGEQLVELRKRGLQTSEEDRPKPTDRRAVTWRPDGRGLAFLQMEAADPKNPQDKPRDRVMMWRAPFTDKDQMTLWSSDTRINSIQYSPDASLLFVNQTVDGKSRLSAVKAMSLDRPVVLSETKPDDTQVSLVTKTMSGGPVVRISPDSSSAYFSGTAYGKDPMAEAPRPFLERVSLADGKRTRIFESRADLFETASIIDDSAESVVVTRQSPSMVPNSFVVNLSTKAETAITENRDYSPDLTQARREWVSITRPDGIKFWAKVTVPANYVAGTRLPAFFWFYPSEFTGQDAYDRGRRTYNKNLFNGMSPSNKTALIRMGYALVEPDSPIIGAADRKNDAYITNLRNDLSAIIDELDRKGYIDRQRLAIGGHSYGAFSTANAMVSTPFFKAGIAGDGNYNRSLTPFGFQSEGRQLWEGREVYLAMSPILYVDQITGALLMYHGLEDQNVGTTPINSERMFAALQANGKPAALYMYPYEDHGQIAQETLLDQWARWVSWLDKWLKK